MDVEMESIPPPGLYSGTSRNRPSLTDRPQYLSPIQSRPTTPAPATTNSFTSSLENPVLNDATSSQPPAPGRLPNGGLLASASITPVIGAASLKVYPVSEFASAADDIRNAECSNNTRFTQDFTGAPHLPPRLSSTGNLLNNPIRQPDQHMNESIYHRVRRVEDQVKEISEGMKSFQSTHSNLTPPETLRAPRAANDNALMASTVPFSESVSPNMYFTGRRQKGTTKASRH